MQTANILLSLGGDHGNQISKFGVTAAEIAVLRAIHGDESVQDVEPTGDVKRSNRQERERLVAIYGAAKNEQQQRIVDTMFPGVAARVFETIEELELPDQFFKATGRMTANDVAERAGSVEAVDDAPEFETEQNDEDDAEAGVGDDINDDVSKAAATETKDNVLG